MRFRASQLFAAAVLTATLAAPQTSDTPGATPGGGHVCRPERMVRQNRRVFRSPSATGT